MDDYGVGGHDDAGNIASLDALFQAMQEVSYKLGADKLWLGYLEMTFMGFLLKNGSIMPDPEKTRAITELLPPKTRTQLRAYLGITGYYRIFIQNYAGIAKPLTTLLKEDVAWKWGSDQ